MGEELGQACSATKPSLLTFMLMQICTEKYFIVKNVAWSPSVREGWVQQNYSLVESVDKYQVGSNNVDVKIELENWMTADCYDNKPLSSYL